MPFSFTNYITNRFNDIPFFIYHTFIVLLCFAIVISSYCGFRKSIKIVFGVLLVEYVILILCSTVIYRTHNDIQSFCFSPFWSYFEIKNGNKRLALQNIMNIVAFSPIGFLSRCTSKHIKLWHVMIFGLSLSVIIETLQFFLKRGFAEFDDIFHNVVGCLVGYGVFCVLLFTTKLFIFKKCQHLI